MIAYLLVAGYALGLMAALALRDRLKVPLPRPGEGKGGGEQRASGGPSTVSSSPSPRRETMDLDRTSEETSRGRRRGKPPKEKAV